MHLRPLLGLLLALAAPAVIARPEPNARMDDQIVQRQDLAYRFTTLTLDSNDGQRHYQLWVGQPRRPAPATGYPVVWMLDGNAAVGALNERLLADLADGDAPLLVAVGYAGEQRIDRTARSFDYTPALDQSADALTGQPSGGADDFLDLLMQRMRPMVAQHWRLDPAQQTLWGHSYGGLLVLHALFTRPVAFSQYVAASPSLWWGNGAALREARHAVSAPPATQLRLMRGTAEPAAPGRASAPGDDAAMQALLAQLRQRHDLNVRYQTFDGLGHGPMLPASLQALLR